MPINAKSNACKSNRPVTLGKGSMTASSLSMGTNYNLTQRNTNSRVLMMAINGAENNQGGAMDSGNGVNESLFNSNQFKPT